MFVFGPRQINYEYHHLPQVSRDRSKRRSRRRSFSDHQSQSRCHSFIFFSRLLTPFLKGRQSTSSDLFLLFPVLSPQQTFVKVWLSSFQHSHYSCSKRYKWITFSSSSALWVDGATGPKPFTATAIKDDVILRRTKNTEGRKEQVC